MKARAPGKVVISGAYSILWGAPAIVTAVDRYAEADTERPTAFVSEEMRQALPPPYPYFDATALRSDTQKLGLGSSAAILLAALGCVAAEDPEQPATRVGLFEQALFAHRRAQAGGSGVDVAASTFGGTLSVQLPEPLAPSPSQYALGCLPRLTPVQLPSVLIEVWASPEAASTQDFIRKVSGWALQSPNDFEPVMVELSRAAHTALGAVTARDPVAFIAALDAQSRGLERLGSLVGLPICVPAVVELAALARNEGASVLPAGAGGGDVSLYVGTRAPSNALRSAQQRAGLQVLELGLAARGVHRA